MKNKITLFGLLLAVSGIFGCSTPECRVEDFNGNCCIDESFCGNHYDSDTSNSEAIAQVCKNLGEYYMPILCPDAFNTDELSTYTNCTKIEVKRMCKGGDDLLNGAPANTFDVYCCK